MADADKPTQQKPPPSTTKKKTKAQTAAMKEQMAKMQKLLQAQRQSLEALQKKKDGFWLLSRPLCSIRMKG